MNPDNGTHATVSRARSWDGTGRPLEIVRRPEAFPPYAGQTYYDLAPIKHSHYRWRTALAFFCNGLAGGAQIIATKADWFGGEGARVVVRAGRYLAVAGGAGGTAILISALHYRPRWFNTVRLFKTTSPMSIGIWSLTAFMMASAMTAAGQWLEDAGHARAGRAIGRVFGLPAAGLGSLVMAYMGTELEGTQMPLWSQAHPALAPLYAAAGMADASAALLLMAGNRSTPPVRRALERLAFLSTGAEAALGAPVHAIWRRSPATRSFGHSAYDVASRVTEAGWAGSLMLRLSSGFDGHRPCARSTLASLVGLATGLLMQVAMVYGGRRSGMAARDYFEATRAEKNRIPVLPGRPSAVRRAGRRPSPGVILSWGVLAAGAAAMVLALARGKEGAHATH